MNLFAPPPPEAPHPAAEVPLQWTTDQNGRRECYRGAMFSRCRLYRAQLWRLWDPGLPFAQFVCLNPSTATETEDDPTVRRVMGYAEAWGFGGVCMTNLFAFRATDPEVMKAHPSPVDPEDDPGWNQRMIERVAEAARVVVLAFGNHGRHLDRAESFARSLRHVRRPYGDGTLRVTALQVNGDGSPGHPLYLKADLTPQPFDLDTLHPGG